MKYNNLIENLEDEEILKAFGIVIPYLNELSRDDLAFGVTDTEKYVYYEDAKEFSLELKEGSKTFGIIDESLKSGKIKKGETNIDGKKVRSIVMPIKNSNGKIIGTISSGIDLDNSNFLVNSINEISEALEQVSISVNELAKTATNLAVTSQNTIKQTQITMETSNKTSEALGIIKSIADQTNLLGLNAAIESARAGEYGKGFNVVASEIRKLANQSKESTATINGIIKKMNDSVVNTIEVVNESAAASEEQAAVIEEINATIETINGNVKKLSEFSERFV